MCWCVLYVLRGGCAPGGWLKFKAIDRDAHDADDPLGVAHQILRWDHPTGEIQLDLSGYESNPGGNHYVVFTLAHTPTEPHTQCHNGVKYVPSMPPCAVRFACLHHIYTQLPTAFDTAQMDVDTTPVWLRG